MKFGFLKRDPIAKFWSDFEKTAADIVRTGDLLPRHAKTITSQLNPVHKDLVWQVGKEEGSWSLEISGEGVKEMIPIVRRVVAAAPAMPMWTVVAFRQRCPVGTKLAMNGREFSSADIEFASRVGGHKLDVVFYIRGITRANHQELIGASFILLDSLLGEYDVMTKLGEIDFLPYPPGDPSIHLRAFEELRELADALPTR